MQITQQLLKEKLEAGLHYQSIELSDLQIQQLLDYINLLEKWNKVYNLTSIKDKRKMVILHLLDSLSILNKIKSLASQFDHKLRIIDVGTGGGLPGIPLSICLPEVDFTLLDARDKKIRFLKQVSTSLQLKNVQTIHSRVEDYVPELKLDMVITRAFSSLIDMLGICSHLCHTNGFFLAMKGKQPVEEISQIPEHYIMQSMQALQVYQLYAERHLLVIQEKS
ncbi:MAG: 16S rRNA (guanine(527)-N(7))-methyltransferase RsmG [Pseudomonadota bacterium]